MSSRGHTQSSSRRDGFSSLNNNPGIIHLLQHWRHHYRATTAAAGSSLQIKTLAHALIN